MTTPAIGYAPLDFDDEGRESDASTSAGGTGPARWR